MGLAVRDKGDSKPPKLRAAPSRVATHPPMRDDCTCWYEDCGKPLPHIGVLNEDPFCSTQCCRRYYDVAV